MRSTVLLLALASAITFAADNTVVAPQSTVNLQPPIRNLKSPGAITIPQMLSYQGRLTDTLGQPVPDNNYSVTFKLYTLPSGGLPFWNETQSVKTRVGLFGVLLGSVTPIASMPAAGVVYLGMAIEGDAEMTPRLRIVSAAYAYKADTANYALSGAGGTDGAWVRGGDSVLYTTDLLGLAKGDGQNALIGPSLWSHVNFGFRCTTGLTGQDRFHIAIGGGRNNVASGTYSTVAGGTNNRATGQAASIVGGDVNTASAYGSAVGGGYSSIASGDNSVVGGGAYNAASGMYSVVGGGRADSATALYGGIQSGYDNIAGDAAADTAATVAGGYTNKALARYAFVGGGRMNVAGNGFAAVAGGYSDSATGNYSFVGGGASNTASATQAAVGGGGGNDATGNYSFIGGGLTNSASQTSAVVAGGSSNRASGNWSAVGGGNGNVASGNYSTVCGGSIDSATATYSFATGAHNVASGYGATVAGGTYNRASGYGGMVLAGQNNFALDSFSSVTGGSDNQASGRGSVIPGGSGNRCRSDNTLVFGEGVVDTSNYPRRVVFFGAANSGALALNDENGGLGVPLYVGTNGFNGNGAYLSSSGVWVDASKRSQCNGEGLDGGRVLADIRELDIERWKLKGQECSYISPVSGDFNRTFGCSRGSEETDTTSISPLDVASVSLAGVQELIRRLDAQQAEIEQLKAELRRR